MTNKIKKTVRWAPDVSSKESSTSRHPKKSIPEITPHVVSKHHASYDRTEKYQLKYLDEYRAVWPEYRPVYPPFGIWRAFHRHTDYRTNVEDYMRAAMYPGMSLENTRIMHPPGFSLKRT